MSMASATVPTRQPLAEREGYLFWVDLGRSLSWLMFLSRLPPQPPKMITTRIAQEMVRTNVTAFFPSSSDVVIVANWREGAQVVAQASSLVHGAAQARTLVLRIDE